MQFRTHSSLIALTTVLVLGACGGSGGDSSTPQNPASPASISISGQAAGPSALSSRDVRARCRSGSGQATTDGNGRYRVQVADGVFPCVMRIELAGGGALHSVATDGGAGSATSNITPLTELTVAQLTGSPPATYYDSGFTASNGSAVTATAVERAATQLTATLAGSGVNTGAAGNPVTSTLVPAGSGTADGHGQALTALDTALQRAGTPLPTLVATVASASPTAGTPTSSAPSLPAAQSLQTQAANCKALRSGRYRAVFNGADAPEVMTIDAGTLSGTSGDGSSFTLTANGPCRFRMPSGGELVVSAAGVITGQANDAPYTGIVLFPEQTHDLSAVAGTIDFLGLDRVDGNTRPQLTSVTMTIAASGEVTAIEFCATMKADCTKLAKGEAGFPTINIVVNPAGGFLLRNTTENYEDPFFVYTTGSGEKMYVLGSASGHISFGTRNAARALPAVGTVSESWNLSLVPNATEPSYTAPFAMSQSKNTIATLGTTSYVRNAVVDFNTGVTVPETVELNVPRAGYVRRVPGPATGSDGSARTVGEWVALGLRGTGLSAVGIVGNQNLILSTQKTD